MAFTLGEDTQENPFTCSFIHSFIHINIQHLLSTHYGPGTIKWEVRQTMVPVLMKHMSLWRLLDNREVLTSLVSMGRLLEGSITGGLTLNWRVRKKIPEEETF